MPNTKAGKLLLEQIQRVVEDGLGEEIWKDGHIWYENLVAAIEAEAQEQAFCEAGTNLRDLIEETSKELKWRDVEDWRKAIISWLGPQRCSIYSGKEIDRMAQGAVVACAILYHLKGQESAIS